ncbi:MAG: 2-hydroxycyclohexanecarboxyl-CoA dehydrogenase [Solirubrobacteraceae bacterium]|jgi:2-hydroxycyclohexanecarboxyl-CoA dehydrogenase|nr:2-hydroxycyclohexanecarboxyl-CoA dehydrogenase [Solirubrobacteraceae bacterium]
MRLEGRTALVTGGASGIGAATARRLSGEGASVAVADIHEDGARDVAGELDGVALAMDVTDVDSIRTAVAAAVEALGPLDVLVNNAGGGGGFAPVFFVDTEEAEWDNTLALNLRSVMAVTHAVLPAMQKRGRGAIVNVASEAGRVGSQLSVSYSAAKAGVIGFTKAIAREGAHYGVRCNAVAPGPIETPLLETLTEISDLGARLRQGMIDATLMGRAGTADEVAATITFLACDDASFITGQTVGVSGGLSLS